jgi:erythromycin esterase
MTRRGLPFIRAVRDLAFLAAGAAVLFHSSSSASDGDRAAFMQWAEKSLVPLSTVEGDNHEELSALGRAIGDARIVAMSEAVHAAAEPLEFRNRLFRYLVEQKGFTAIAIESGIVESRVVHDYVRGGPGTASNVLAQGISWTFHRLPQNAALVSWLREYNAESRHGRKVNFYGFDVPGSPGNKQASRGMDTALIEALRYLRVIDTAAAAAFSARFEPFWRNLRFDLRRAAEEPGYDRLSQASRDALTSAISDLITRFEREERRYVAASSPGDYQWAYRAALGARQLDSWLRQIPLGRKPLLQTQSQSRPNEENSFLSIANDVRDRAQADNLEWIARQEGTGGKILVFASRSHLSSTPLQVMGWTRQQEPAGTYLRRRFGAELTVIGNLVSKGRAGCAGVFYEMEAASKDSMDGLVALLGIPLFHLDLRRAPAAVAAWLDHDHKIGPRNEVYELNIGRAFDIVLFMNSVTPACP